MSHARPIRTLALLALALPVGVACSPLNPRSTPENALWFPYAEAGLATVNRSTSYAIQHSSSSDLLIYEIEQRFTSGAAATRLTWLLEVPTSAPVNKPLELGRSADGWLFEQISGKPTHGAPLAGTITITQKTADLVTGVVNVYAVTGTPDAGQPTGDRVRLARQLSWQRSSEATIGPKEPETRGGITYQQQTEDTQKELR